MPLGRVQQVVMVVPVDAQHHEAEDVGQKHRGERLQRGQVGPVRRLQLQHDDRDQDRDHAVAEGLETRLVHGVMLDRRDGASSGLRRLADVGHHPRHAAAAGAERRWPLVLERELRQQGRDVRVIEDCLNGRRTVWDDPVQGGAERPGRPRTADRGQLAAGAGGAHARHQRLSVGAPERRLAVVAGRRRAGSRDSARADRARHAGAPHPRRRAAADSHACR